MLALLLEAAEASPEIEASLAYRRSQAYDDGLRRRLPAGVPRQLRGVRLPDPESLWSPLDGAARKLTKAAAYALLLRQFFQAYDVARLAAVFTSTKPDIVHINNGGFPGAASGNAAAVAARLAGVRHIVYVVNNLAADYGSPLRWADYPLDRLVARCVSHFVTGSRAAAERLTRLLHLPPGHVVSMPHGIQRRETDEPVEAVRARLGQADSRVVLLVPAQLERRKGHRHLVNALQELHAGGRLDGVGVLFAGDGPEEDALRNQVERLGLSSRVRFVPREPNWWNFYLAADVVVLPSISHEDLPNVVAEAMAMGKPVIGSRLAGIPEQIVDGVTGVLVSPGNEHELAEAIATLAENRELRERLGAAGLERYEAYFTPAAACDRYFSLYRDLLDAAR
jgi:glycosyltransferase involved in cell wall biosynthesis